MKTVFSGASKLAHVWAAQSQPRGRAGNVYFDGETIYSYGPHYPIARFVEPDLVFWNDTSSTPTTNSRHRPKVWQALHGHAARVIPVGWPTMNPREAVAYLATKYTEEIGKAGRARAYTRMYLETADRAYVHVLYLVKRYDLEVPTLPTVDRFALNDKARNQDAQREVRYLAQQQRRDAECARWEAQRIEHEAQQRAEYADKFTRWCAGENVQLPYSYGDQPTALRLSPDGQSVQTSRGAEVPLVAAQVLWQMIAHSANG